MSYTGDTPNIYLILLHVYANDSKLPMLPVPSQKNEQQTHSCKISAGFGRDYIDKPDEYWKSDHHCFFGWSLKRHRALDAYSKKT